MIHVCSLARLHEIVRTGARHVVSLIGDEGNVVRPHAVAPENHLWLRLHDISSPLDGYIMPGEEHVADLIRFVRGWDRRSPPGDALLHGHQPLDGERLCQRLRAQSAARRARHRAGAAPRLADGDTQNPHRVACGSGCSAATAA